jgi:hypothetical protein
MNEDSQNDPLKQPNMPFAARIAPECPGALFGFGGFVSFPVTDRPSFPGWMCSIGNTDPTAVFCRSIGMFFSSLLCGA